MANTFIRGNELYVYMGGEAVGYATTSSLEITSDTIDTSNKQSGVWASGISGQISWTVSTDALIVKATDGSNSHTAIFDAMVAQDPVEIEFGYGVGSGEEVTKGQGWYKGKAYITSCSISADNGSVASMSISFQGEGALAKATV